MRLGCRRISRLGMEDLDVRTLVSVTEVRQC